jgi:NAD(P)-dependent dehydrogenase (short-subunit alcohol dehydrogenase family)
MVSVMDHGLAGATAIVTGGSSGIGFAIARGLAAAGASLVLAGRNRGLGAAAERALGGEGARVRFIAADVSSEDDVRDLVAETVRLFGPPSHLVNNAGPSGAAFGLGAIHALPNETFLDAMDIGVMGALRCCRHVLPHMIARQHGVILNISAIAATRALPLMGAYAMSKAAMEALGRQVANDYAREGVRCNNLVVGTVRPEQDDVSALPEGFAHAALDTAIGKTTMMDRVGTYGEAADAAFFLLSEQSRYMTGASIPVEGGALARLAYPDYSEALRGEA